MTIPEIQALRAELEVALGSAFSDFHAKSGVFVESVDVEFIESWQICQPKPDKRITSVTVHLERL